MQILLPNSKVAVENKKLLLCPLNPYNKYFQHENCVKIKVNFEDLHENRLVCREHSQILNSLNVCRQFQCYLTISHWPSNVNDAKSVWFTGCLHLYSGVEHPCFNQYPEQTDFPDPVKITAILSSHSEYLNLCIVFSCWIDLFLLSIDFDSVVLFEWLKRLVYVLISDLVVNECINILNNTFTQILYNRMD